MWSPREPRESLSPLWPSIRRYTQTPTSWSNSSSTTAPKRVWCSPYRLWRPALSVRASRSPNGPPNSTPSWPPTSNKTIPWSRLGSGSSRRDWVPHSWASRGILISAINWRTWFYSSPGSTLWRCSPTDSGGPAHKSPTWSTRLSNS